MRRGGVELPELAIVEDVLTLDVLHGEVREAVSRRAAVQQAGDVGMLEAGENLALVAEPLHDGIRVGSTLENLDRDALLKHVVAAHREVDGTHPSTTDLADQPIRSYLLIGADVRDNVPGLGDVLVRSAHALLSIRELSAVSFRSHGQ